MGYVLGLDEGVEFFGAYETQLDGDFAEADKGRHVPRVILTSIFLVSPFLSTTTYMWVTSHPLPMLKRNSYFPEGRCRETEFAVGSRAAGGLSFLLGTVRRGFVTQEIFRMIEHLDEGIS